MSFFNENERSENENEKKRKIIENTFVKWIKKRDTKNFSFWWRH
jgi:GMP synthase PP-ATPase subunit